MRVRESAGMNNRIYSEHNRQRLSRFRAIVLALLLAGGAGAFTWNQLQAKDNARPAPVKLAVSEKPVTRETGVTSFAPIVKKVTPSVVKVYVTATVKNTSHQLPDEFANNPFFRRFFGDDFGGQQFGRNMPSPKQHGLGSGVIVTKDGYLLTNNHVVDNADEVKVALGDGREFTAKVVGKDPKSDIAVVKRTVTSSKSAMWCSRLAIRSVSARPSRAASTAPRVVAAWVSITKT